MKSNCLWGHSNSPLYPDSKPERRFMEKDYSGGLRSSVKPNTWSGSQLANSVRRAQGHLFPASLWTKRMQSHMSGDHPAFQLVDSVRCFRRILQLCDPSSFFAHQSHAQGVPVAPFLRFSTRSMSGFVSQWHFPCGTQLVCSPGCAWT